MSTHTESRRTRKAQHHDTTLFWLGLLVSVIGCIFILDAGYAQSMQVGGGMVPRTFIAQCLVLAIGMGVFFAVRRIRVEWLQKYAKWILGAVFISLILVEIPGIGIEHNNARRWLGAGGVEVQPAEFAKLAVILYVASALAKKVSWESTWAKRKKFKDTLNQVVVPKLERLWPAFVVLLVCYLVEREKDLGTACVILATSIIVFLMAPVTRKSVVIIGLIVAVGVSGLAFKEQYRVKRMLAHANRWDRENINNDTYQSIHSEMAMASGGFLGTGFGSGRAKHMLPATTSDFIMATVSEECGTWGTMLCLGLVGAISLRLLKLSQGTEDKFKKLVLAGVGWWLVIQASTNLMMANATLPAIGIPFPFISAGGSSLISIWLALGICDRLSMAPQKQEEEVRVAHRRHWWRNRRSRLSGA